MHFQYILSVLVLLTHAKPIPTLTAMKYHKLRSAANGESPFNIALTKIAKNTTRCPPNFSASTPPMSCVPK